MFTAEARQLSESIKQSGGSLTGVSENLVDLVWAGDRPTRPAEKVKVQPIEFAGKSFEEKIDDLRKELEKKKKAGFVICMRSESALLFLKRNYIDQVI